MATLNKSWYLHPLRLDSADGAIVERFHGAPEDAHGRGIALAVTDGGEPMDLTGCTVSLAWSDPAGTGGMCDFTATDASKGKFEVLYPSGMAEHAPCDIRACVMVYSAGAITSSREFAIHVRKPIVTDDMAEADPNFSSFVQGVLELRTALDDIQAKSDAWAEAEAARVSAESARKSNEATRQSNESARKTAESARVSAEASRQSTFDAWLESYGDGMPNLEYVSDEVAVQAIEALF